MMRFSPLCLTGFMLGLAGPVIGQLPVLYSHGEPTPHEQLMLEWINHARANPEAEMARLGISLNQGLNPGQIPAGPKPPLAMNQWLLASARAHSEWMLDTDIFSHTGQGGSTAFQRMEAAGYPFGLSRGWGENISWRGTTGTPDVTALTRANHDGLMRSPGHRMNLLSPGHDEIGLGVVQGPFRSGIEFNANMVTQDFARSAGSPTPSAPLLLGVVFSDLDNDAAYDAGEGLGGVTITTNAGTHYTVTSSSGGYALPGPGTVPGDLVVFASSGGIPAMQRTIDWNGTANVKVDFAFVGPDADGDGVGDQWDLAETSSTPPVHVGAAVSWDPSPGTSGAASFEARGLPRGLSINPLTGQIRGRVAQPGAYTAMVRFRRGTEWSPWQSVNFDIRPWPTQAIGSHFGLLERENTVNQSLGGTVGLTTNASGFFSGNVRLGGVGYGFRGQLAGEVGDVPRARATVIRKNLPPILIDLELNPDGSLAGAVSIETQSAPVTGWKKTWDGKSNPLPASLRGYFTANLFTPQLASLDSRPLPEGAGWMIVRTDMGGTAIFSGKTANGEIFSGTFPMGPVGEIAVWSLFQRSPGSLMGWSVISGNHLDGSLGWVRLPSSSRLYPLGFGSAAQPVPLLVFGALYTSPALGGVQTAWKLTADNPNARASFWGAGLPGSALSPDQNFHIKAYGAVVMPNALNNPAGVRISLSPRDGKFSGHFNLVDPHPNLPGKFLRRRADFDGVVVLRESDSPAFGQGRFVLADLPVPGQPENATLIRSGWTNLGAILPPPEIAPANSTFTDSSGDTRE